jgi:hypothetical protein
MAQHIARSPTSRILWLLLLCATPLWTLWLIYSYGVDVPYWDVWEAGCPLFVKLHAGTLGIADFLGFQNEHRVVFPRIIGFGLGVLTHWNIRSELFVTWALAWVGVINLWRLSRLTGFGNSRLRPWLLAGVAFLIFTPVQHETWLLGISAYQPLILCLTACLWIPFVTRPGVAFLWTMALGTISTFSFASGFLVWILAAPLLWMRTTEAGGKRYRVWWIVWVVALSLSLFLYFHGFQKPDRSPSPYIFFQQPLSAFNYLLAYLGADFASDTFAASNVGAFLTLLFFACIFSLWQHRGDRQLLMRALPWAMLPCFAFASAIITTIGRMGFGVDQALSTRYIIFSGMLPVGLLFLVPLLIIELPDERVFGMRRPLRAGIMAFFALVLACLQIVVSINLLQNWTEFHRTRLNYKAALTFIDVLPDARLLKKLSYEEPALLKQNADDLDRIDDLRPKLATSTAIRAVADPNSPGNADYGEFVKSRFC